MKCCLVYCRIDVYGLVYCRIDVFEILLGLL